MVNIQASYVMLCYVYDLCMLRQDFYEYVADMSLVIPLGWIQGVIFMGTG